MPQGIPDPACAPPARIEITLRTPAGLRKIHRTVSSGGSFGSNPLRQEIGLGDATEIVAVEIRWPGTEAPGRYTGLALNQAYRIREPDPKPTLLPLRRVKFARR